MYVRCMVAIHPQAGIVENPLAFAAFPEIDGAVPTVQANPSRIDHQRHDGSAEAQEPMQESPATRLDWTVASWLHEAKLHMCEAALAEVGYDAELDMIIDGDAEEVADMIGAVESIEGIKKPIVKKFKRELAKVRGKGESL